MPLQCDAMSSQCRHVGALFTEGPFRALPFEQLPDEPRRPHPFERVPGRALVVPSAHFGDPEIHLRELGDGPPLLLVHGLMTHSYSWRYVFEPLAQHFRVIAPDLPGCGRSAKPRVTYGAEQLATFVTELIDALDIGGCSVIGNSLGGYLCLRAALRSPDRFGKLVDIHSPALPQLRLHALHGLLSVPGVGAALARFVRRDPQRWAHRNVHYFDESLKSREEAREYGDPLASQEGAAAFVSHLRDSLAPSGFRELLAELAARRDRGEPFPVPLLLLYARADPMVHPKNGRVLARHLPDARFVWLDDSSHFAHVDSPQRTLEPVLAFLK